MIGYKDEEARGSDVVCYAYVEVWQSLYWCSGLMWRCGDVVGLLYVEMCSGVVGCVLCKVWRAYVEVW